MSEPRAPAVPPRSLAARRGPRVAALLEREPRWARDFDDLSFEGRRLFSELFGTFLLVLAGAGAPVVDHVSGGQIGRTAAVVAPAATVLAVILFMGAVSGAHLNPVVSIAFALRRDFQWRRVPGYVTAQLAGAALAAVVLRLTFGDVAHLGATLPGPGFGAGQAFTLEVVLTLGLVSTILGTASTAQNVGTLSALGVASYIALAGLWASPVSGASMNPVRSAGPALVGGDLHDLWLYLAGPTLGMLLAVGAAHILRGPGGDPDATRAAQGTLGLPATPDAVVAAENDPDADRYELGIPLSPSETAEMLPEITQLLDATVKNRPDYAGIWIDQSSGGTIHILTTGSTAEVLAAALAVVPADFPVVVSEAAFTLAQLEAAKDMITALSSQDGAVRAALASWGVRAKDNRVLVGLRADASSDAIAGIEALGLSCLRLVTGTGLTFL